MSQVRLPDPGLGRFGLEDLGPLQELRDGLFRRPVEICIERARHMTAYLRDLADSADPMVIRRAKALRHFLQNKTVHFPDANLLGGTTTSKALGAPLYCEFTGLTIWPELDTISTRSVNPQRLTAAEAGELNLDIFPYWLDRSVLETARTAAGSDTKAFDLSQQLIHFIPGKAGCISHTVPDYSVVVERGLRSLIDEAFEKESALVEKEPKSVGDLAAIDWYNAVQIVLNGVLDYADNIARKALETAASETDPDRKSALRTIAKTCSRVPALPARNFLEAVNAVWFAHIAVHAENINMAVSPGRLDQVLFRHYAKDIDEGALSVREALEILGCLWLKLADNVNMVPETAEKLWGGAGTSPALTLGGIDRNGDDAVNDLTYLMLRITELLGIRDPNTAARFHFEKNPHAYLLRLCEVIKAVNAPAVHNDAAVIRTLERQGLPTGHSRDYAVIGCVELASSGRSYDSSSSIMLNLAAPLELALFNGRRPESGPDLLSFASGDPSSFHSFDAFMTAFESQLRWLIDQAISLNERLGRAHQESCPTPLLSALFEGPLAKGKDLIFGGAVYNSSGATHIGFADTVDSLNAIEQAVFTDRVTDFAGLLAALGRNFQGDNDARLLRYLSHDAPKYGTDHPVASRNAERLVRFLFDTYQSRVNYRGGRYRPAFWTVTNHSGQGTLTRALPNGRLAGRPFASGITPVSGAADQLTSCLNAVAGLNQETIPGGMALNLKFFQLSGPSDLERMSQYIEAYFRQGGMQVQFNILSYETLKDARKHPGKYPHLMVRVSGYSAYFDDLNDAMKRELIERTEYDVTTGRSNPFPGF
jgi:formate C-acetyltransferase